MAMHRDVQNYIFESVIVKCCGMSLKAQMPLTFLFASWQLRAVSQHPPGLLLLLQAAALQCHTSQAGGSIALQNGQQYIPSRSRSTEINE